MIASLRGVLRPVARGAVRTRCFATTDKDSIYDPEEGQGSQMKQMVLRMTGYYGYASVPCARDVPFRATARACDLGRTRITLPRLSRTRRTRLPIASRHPASNQCAVSIPPSHPFTPSYVASSSRMTPVLLPPHAHPLLHAHHQGGERGNAPVKVYVR